MSTYQVQTSAHISAPAQLVYAIIADYRNGHPHILPSYFSNLVVEEGGIGAGTRIRFDMTALGRKQTFRATVSEPEPGRVLLEDNGPKAGSMTTFTVDPVAQGAEAQVTITTQFQQRSGLGGLIERFISGLFLRRVYAQELQLLAKVARERQQTENGAGSRVI
jgi:hypothetical protein